MVTVVETGNGQSGVVIGEDADVCAIAEMQYIAKMQGNG